MKGDVKIFFHLTTFNRGFLGYSTKKSPVTWIDHAFRDFDETIAQMLIEDDNISYIKNDLFSLDTPWNAPWQEIADRAAEFCKILFHYDLVVFRESTLFLTFPFWRKVLLQSGVKFENLHILYPFPHPFVHFGHLRNQTGRGMLFRPIHSYKRSVLEQINRLYYMFLNLANEKCIVFPFLFFMHEMDSCFDCLESLLCSTETTEILIRDISEELIPYPDEAISLPQVKNAIADELVKIQFEFSEISAHRSNTALYSKNALDISKIVNLKYGSFFSNAAKFSSRDVVEDFVFSKEDKAHYEVLFELNLSQEENSKL